jgi:hypothetical protein
MKQKNKIKNIETINIFHKELTDGEAYKNIKRIYKQSNSFMNPTKWKNLRLIELKREGKVWSK